MAEDIEFDLEENESRESKRVKALSEKVETTAKERDELAKAKADAEEARLKAEKERDFYASFSDSIAKYPQASDYKDSIKDKVLSGYDVSDAVVAVLAKEGKLQTTTEQRPEKNVAGGSAETTITSQERKSVKDMNQEERLKELLEAERRGEIGFS